MLINTEDIWNEITKNSHEKFVNDLIAASATKRSGRLFNYLLAKHGQSLAVGGASRLVEVIADIEHRRAQLSATTNRKFHRECEMLFNYESFSNKRKKGWNAYQLCSASKYIYCPYCQELPAYTIYTDPKSKSLRPSLDHFYSKKQYPYLALSLYNLVPSCSTCNSSLKGDGDFYEKPHLNPYLDEESVCYTVDVETYLDSVSFPQNKPDHIISIEAPKTSNPNYDKTKNSISTFLLRERLERNQIQLSRFVTRLRSYNQERLSEAAILLNIPFNRMTEEDAIDFKRDNYKNEVLGVAKRDIYDLLWG